MSFRFRLISLFTSVTFLIFSSLALAAPPEGKGKPDGDDQSDMHCHSLRTLQEFWGADVEGRTSTEQILARACDWVEPGTGVNTFPNFASAPMESSNLLDNLLA